MPAERSHTGILAAAFIICAWFACLYFLLNWDFSFSHPLVYILILVQMHLYTGLFITAHDAMHGTVSANRRINDLTGWICTLLYACFSYRGLREKHHMHHRFVHSDQDPDYHHGNFIRWYISFIGEYITWWQIAAMAVLFNIFKIWIAEPNLLMFWVLPSLLSTLQLFYFGTWLPHHGSHDNLYQSRTQSKNHIRAFVSCYFFGYHYEHHDSPGTPWWRLWRLK